MRLDRLSDAEFVARCKDGSIVPKSLADRNNIRCEWERLSVDTARVVSGPMKMVDLETNHAGVESEVVGPGKPVAIFVGCPECGSPVEAQPAGVIGELDAALLVCHEKHGSWRKRAMACAFIVKRMPNGKYAAVVQ